MVDALGNPLDFILTPGQACDLEGADAFLPDLQADALLADKAFDADERVLKILEEKGIQAVIPITNWYYYFNADKIKSKLVKEATWLGRID